MTERLYELDAYLSEFEAQVLSCEPCGEYFGVVLDKTAFFPEGGGQPADKGKLGDAKVIDVQINEGIVVHTVKEPLEKGTKVSGEVDFELRFARMQAHTAEHIVAGTINSLFGYSNIGFHLTDELVTADFSGPLNGDEIENIEILANKAVFKNVPISASYPTEEELSKITYRSKIDPKEDLRIVTIEGVDCCACCAPHLARTGEAGVIKIIDFYPCKHGTRIEMIAGLNAVKDYAFLNASNKKMMKMMSAPRTSVVDVLTKQLETVSELKNENQKLSQRLALSELAPVDVKGCALAFAKNLSYDDLRYCANNLTESGTEICVLLSENDDGYIYVVSSKEKDTRPIVQALNSNFSGKGGGKPDYAQGKISKADANEIKTLIETLL